jgi:hypothetical protein
VGNGRHDGAVKAKGSDTTVFDYVSSIDGTVQYVNAEKYDSFNGIPDGGLVVRGILVCRS